MRIMRVFLYHQDVDNLFIKAVFKISYTVIISSYSAKILSLTVVVVGN